MCDRNLIEELEQLKAENQQLKQQLATKDERISQLETDKKQLKADKDHGDKLINYVHSVATNTGMTTTDRAFSIHLALSHPDELVSGAEFAVNVANVRKEVGIGKDSAANYFKGMKEAGAIEYQTIKSDNGEKISTQSRMSFKPGSALVSTREAPSRIEERQADIERYQDRKLKAVTAPACPQCGAVPTEANVLHICGAHGVYSNQAVPAEKLCVVSEEQADPEPLTPVTTSKVKELNAIGVTVELMPNKQDFYIYPPRSWSESDTVKHIDPYRSAILKELQRKDRIHAA